MKKILLLTVFTCITLALEAQQWVWTKNLAGGYGGTMREDAAGNIYTAIGTGSNPDVTQFMKMDSAGSVLWTHTLNCVVTALVVNSSRAVIGGYFTDSARFGNLLLQTSAPGTTDGFVVSYDLAGNMQWARQAMGLMGNSVTSIEGNAAGDIFACFHNDTTAVFSGMNFSKGLGVVVLSSSGSITDHFEVQGKVFSAELSIDDYDNIYLIGRYGSDATIDTTTIHCSDTYYGAHFVGRFHRNGSIYWARDQGSVFRRSLNNLRVHTGNIYLTESNVYDSSILIKYAPSGSLIWNKNFGSTIYAETYDVVLDAQENLYMTGVLWYNGRFGTCMPAGNQYFLYLAKMDSSGNCYWSNSGQATDETAGIALSVERGHVMMLGWDMGTSTVSLPPYTAQGPNFLGKISESSTTGIQPVAIPEISLYPNPTNGVFRIQSDKFISRLEVCNVLGEKVYTQITNATTAEVNLAGCPGQMYYVKMYFANGSYSIRKITKH